MLTAVQPYSKRRPRTRLVRLLAALFPDDTSCIVDAHRLWQLVRLLSIQPVKGEFIAHHPLIRHRLKEILSSSGSLEEQVEQSIFTWFLWKRFVGQPAEGSVVTDRGPNVATDV